MEIKKEDRLKTENKEMIIDLIAGARPNFIKIAPLIRAIQEHIDKGLNIKYRLVHTGQHYDNNMSSQFLENLIFQILMSTLVQEGEHKQVKQLL